MRHGIVVGLGLLAGLGVSSPGLRAADATPDLATFFQLTDRDFAKQASAYKLI